MGAYAWPMRRSAMALAGSTRTPRRTRMARASRRRRSRRTPRTCARGARSRDSVAEALIDGLRTRYEMLGDGPPLLMYAPGGFDATIEKWSTQGVYARVKLLEHLPKKFRCIVFDRRECGQSAGRLELITWAHYARHGKLLLEHLGIERAHVMGGCMGVSCVMAFAVAHPAATLSMLLWWPVGGAKYRIKAHQRFAEHVAYATQHGLGAVVALAKSSDTSFGQDPRCGPWVSLLRRDSQFADAFVR